MSEAKSESLGGSTPRGSSSEQSSGRVTVEVVGEYLIKVDFNKDKRVIDNISIPEKISEFILKDQEVDPSTQGICARHIIPKRAIINYWERH